MSEFMQLAHDITFEAEKAAAEVEKETQLLKDITHQVAELENKTVAMVDSVKARKNEQANLGEQLKREMELVDSANMTLEALRVRSVFMENCVKDFHTVSTNLAAARDAVLAEYREKAMKYESYMDNIRIVRDFLSSAGHLLNKGICYGSVPEIVKTCWSNLPDEYKHGSLYENMVNLCSPFDTSVKAAGNLFTFTNDSVDVDAGSFAGYESRKRKFKDETDEELAENPCDGPRTKALRGMDSDEQPEMSNEQLVMETGGEDSEVTAANGDMDEDTPDTITADAQVTEEAVTGTDDVPKMDAAQEGSSQNLDVDPAGDSVANEPTEKTADDKTFDELSALNVGSFSSAVDESGAETY